MCSTSESKQDLELPEKGLLSSSVCMKCGERPQVIVRGRDPMCRECFNTYSTHKFRAALGKAKLIKDKEKVLLAVSGGPRSCCMLHLVKEGLSPSTTKRLTFVPFVVHVDESSVLGCASSKEEVADLAATAGMPFHCTRLEETLQNQGRDPCRGAGCSTVDESLSLQDALDRFLSQADGLTSKESLLQSLRMQAILDVGKRLQCTKIFVGECATTLSIKILTHIAEGRGATLPYDVSFADRRFGDVIVIRPIRDFASNEVAMYNQLHGIECVSHRSITTGRNTKASIRRQTEAFITGLQASFPSTVNTILRTGEKLCITKNLSHSDIACAVCQAPITVTEKESTGVTSAGVTSILKESCSREGEQCCQGQATKRLTRNDLLSSLCYCCQGNLGKLKDDEVTSVPQFVLQRVEHRLQRQQLRENIKEFILDDDGDLVE